MTNETLITQEGLQKLKDELNELKSVRRINVSQRIKEAIALGDLSENSEYDDAKNEQAFIEGRIAELEGKIRTAKIIQETEDGAAKVRIGSHVILEVSKPVTVSTIPSSVRLKPIPSTTGFRMNPR